MKAREFSGIIFGAVRKFEGLLNTKSIFVFWLAGLFLAGILFTTLTGGIRAGSKIKTANAILEHSGETRRIKSAIPEWVMPGRAMQAGSWFELSDNNIALIFTVPVDGVFVPFLAVFDVENEIDKIYPLSRTAEYCVEKANSGFLDVWMARITAAAQIVNRAK
jgi:hypothetical protein